MFPATRERGFISSYSWCVKRRCWRLVFELPTRAMTSRVLLRSALRRAEWSDIRQQELYSPGCRVHSGLRHSFFGAENQTHLFRPCLGRGPPIRQRLIFPKPTAELLCEIGSQAFDELLTVFRSSLALQFRFDNTSPNLLVHGGHNRLHIPRCD